MCSDSDVSAKEMNSIKKALLKGEHVSMEDDGWARTRARRALKHVVGKNLEVLNLGCGPGYDSHEFVKAGHHVTGVDFQQHLVNFSLKNKNQQEALVADLNEKFPFADAKFDLIFCSEVVEHLPIIDDFLEECSRVLKKNGTMLFTTNNPAYVKHRIRLLFGNADFFSHPTHVQLYTPKKFCQLLEKHNFRVLSVENIGNWIFPSLGDDYLVVAVKK